MVAVAAPDPGSSYHSLGSLATWPGTAEGSVMNAATERVTRSRSLIMKYPGGAFAYRHPRACASVDSVVGIWLVVLGAILCGFGYWWGASLFVVAVLPFWIAYQLLQPSLRS
jgi:hypothetical protein